MSSQKFKLWSPAKLKGLAKPALFGPIGVDFGLERLNLVQFEKRGKTKNIVAAVSVPYISSRDELLGSKDELRFFINRILKTYPFRGREVVAALPPRLFQLVHLNYRKSANEDQETALVRAIQERFGDRLESAVIDYLPIRPKVEDQVDRLAMVALSEHQTVVDFLEVMRASRLKVQALEVGSVAIKRLLTSFQEEGDARQKVMAINFATSKSYATVLWGGELLLDREVSVGLDSLLDSITESLDLAPDSALQMLEKCGLCEDESQSSFSPVGEFESDLSTTFAHILKPNFIKMAQELRKILIYTAAETQGGAIDAVYLLGSVARWPGVDKYLAKLINIPVLTVDPLFGYEHDDRSLDKGRAEPVSGIAVATGLALRGVQ